MSASPNAQDFGGLMARVEVLEEGFSKLEPRVRIVERNTPTPEEKRDLELRVRALEAVHWKWLGAIAVVAFLCSIAGPLIAKHLGG